MRYLDKLYWFRRVLKRLTLLAVTICGGKGVPDFYNADRKKIKMGIIFNDRDRKSKWVAAQVC